MHEIQDIQKALDLRARELRKREAELRRDRNQLKRDQAALISVLNLHGSIVGSHRPSKFLTLPPAQPPKKDSSYGILKKAVLATATSIQGMPFSSHDVIAKLNQNPGALGLTQEKIRQNRGTISGYLREFEKKGILRIVSEGGGNTANRYLVGIPTPEELLS